MDSYQINTLLAAATIGGQIAFVVIVIAFLVRKKNNIAAQVIEFVSEERLRLSLLVTFFAVAGSMTYSNIVGFDPCMLCWYQRIFIFPQFVLFLVAVIKGHTREIFDYARALSCVGGAIAAYHYYIQVAQVTTTACSAAGGANCSEQYVLTFGYVSIPMMALTAFVFIILMSYLRPSNNE